MDAVIAGLSNLAVSRGDLDYKLLRVVMVFTFYIFGVQKWNAFAASTDAWFGHLA
jgi:hypothetical protein